MTPLPPECRQQVHQHDLDLSFAWVGYILGHEPRAMWWLQDMQSLVSPKELEFFLEAAVNCIINECQSQVRVWVVIFAPQKNSQ